MGRGEQFDSDGVRIAYDDIQPETGDGKPIVLVHGFASTRVNNWEEPGWYDILRERGRRVVALDNRGHGESDAPHDTAAYDVSTMAGDTVNLLDHLGFERADLFGYSMGGRLAVELVHSHPERFNAAVMGGIGQRASVNRDGNRDAIPRALEADDPATIENEQALAHREMAEKNDGDLDALAAVFRALSEHEPSYDLESVEVPVLVATGSEDAIVGDPTGLAALFGDGESAIIEDEDHLSTVSHPNFRTAVTGFLDRKGL